MDAGLLSGDLSDTGCFCECKKQFYPVTEKRAVTGKGNKTGNSKGETVILKGVSTHGINWFPQYVNKCCISESAG